MALAGIICFVVMLLLYVGNAYAVSMMLSPFTPFIVSSMSSTVAGLALFLTLTEVAVLMKVIAKRA